MTSDRRRHSEVPLAPSAGSCGVRTGGESSTAGNGSRTLAHPAEVQTTMGAVSFHIWAKKRDVQNLFDRFDYQSTSTNTSALSATILSLQSWQCRLKGCHPKDRCQFICIQPLFGFAALILGHQLQSMLDAGGNA